jgi:hypothetical protein
MLERVDGAMVAILKRKEELRPGDREVGLRLRAMDWSPVDFRPSRSPSLRRLKPSTVRPRANPGASETHGATRSRSFHPPPCFPSSAWRLDAESHERKRSSAISLAAPRVAATITRGPARWEAGGAG